jgi:hypothetical protein
MTLAADRVSASETVRERSRICSIDNGGRHSNARFWTCGGAAVKDLVAFVSRRGHCVATTPALSEMDADDQKTT